MLNLVGVYASETYIAELETISVARLRAGPGTNYRSLQTVPRGRTVHLIDIRDNVWFSVRVNNTTGYMLAEELTSPGISIFMQDGEISFPVEFRTTASARLRSQPTDREGRVLRTIPEGRTVQVTGYWDNEWFTVSAAGVNGYMLARYLELVDFTFAARVEEEVVVETPVQQTQVQQEVIAAPVIAPADMLHWHYVRNNVIRNGEILTVECARTGHSWNMTAFSQGENSHADVAPLTHSDTSMMLFVLGGNWHSSPHPVIVTNPNGQRVAASLFGWPHEPTTNHDNGMDGHVCLHFVGSQQNTRNEAQEARHQAVILEAFQRSIGTWVQPTWDWGWDWDLDWDSDWDEWFWFW